MKVLTMQLQKNKMQKSVRPIIPDTTSSRYDMINIYCKCQLTATSHFSNYAVAL